MMSGDSLPRLLLGNFDAEVEMRGGGPLKARALLRIAALSTLMRAFAEEDDVLAVPGEVDSEGMSVVSCLASPRMISVGSLPVASAGHEFPAVARAVLPWAWTPSASRIPVAPRGLAAIGEDVRGVVGGESKQTVRRAVWSFPPAEPDLVRRLHDRRFALGVAQGLGRALPGTAFVTELSDLDERIPAIVSAGFVRVVLKAPLSASGRDRIVASIADLSGPGQSGSKLRSRVQAFLARHGGGVIEPYCERVADYGACAFASDEGVDLRTIHRLHTDERDGRFLGAELGPDLRRPACLSVEHQEAMVAVVHEVGRELTKAGYQGPYGVDSFIYRRVDATAVLHPICEINVRLTMGWVLAALEEQIPGGGARLALDIEPDGGVDFGEPIKILSADSARAWVMPLI